MTILSEYTTDGKEPRPTPRRFKEDGKIYNTFIYPLAGGPQVCIKNDQDKWEDFRWYPDEVKFLDKWEVVRNA